MWNKPHAILTNKFMIRKQNQRTSSSSENGQRYSCFKLELS